MQPSITKLLKRLWQHLRPHRKAQFWLLLALMFFTSLSEIVSIGSVLPFLGVLTSPDLIFSNSLIQPFIHLAGLSEPKQLLFPLTLAFCLTAIIAGAMRLLLLWASTRLSFAVGADLSIDIYRRTLYRPYIEHCARNSSEIINGISGKSHLVIYGVVVPVLTLISSGLMLIAILFALLAVNPVIALAAFGGFGCIYIFIITLTRKQVLINSQLIASESSNVIKSIQEGLGGIRDVLIDGSQSVYCHVYRQADLTLRQAQGSNYFVSQSPRYVMEALGMLLISVLAYSLASSADGVSKAIPILGALALGAQRLLPVLQQAYASWSSILGGKISLQDTIELLDQPLPDGLENSMLKPMSFQDSINLKQIDFRYSVNAPFVLRRLNLVIAKGSRVGFIGATGSGKSTLLDIIMGLLHPTEGVIEIDGQAITAFNRRAWQLHIAHVPQTIFLSDSSIEENIAFGVPKDEIDYHLVRVVAKQAQIQDLIESWPDNYKTFVGERGIRLSGGQRQRIGIARALYKQADVIIFDEATSALDSETEVAVMQAIEGLSEHLTILIIAHRLTTLKKCTQIVELSDGGIKRVGTYQQIVSVP